MVAVPSGSGHRPFYETLRLEKGMPLSPHLGFQSHWKGLVPYKEGLLLQSEMARVVRAEGTAQILGQEHPGVITLGLRGRADKDLLNRRSGFPVVQVERGGEATIHNPGQLVIYPIVPLRSWNLGVREFVELLLKVTEEFLKELGIFCFRKKEPGLYTKRGKIALMGLQIQNGVSSHGLAINVSNVLDVFEDISVCGVQKQPMDAVSQYVESPQLEALFYQWVKIFNTEFNSRQRSKNKPLPIWQNPSSVLEH